MKIIILFGILVVSKIIYNFYYFLTARRYYSEYKKLVKESDSWFIKEHRQSIVNLFKNAGITDTEQPTTELGGYGVIRTGNFSVFRNLALLRDDIVPIVNGFFHEAIGIYRQRIFESVNPIFWIEAFFKLPTTIFQYLGVGSRSFIVKLFQLLWWLVVAISTIVGIIFNKEFMSWIQKFI